MDTTIDSQFGIEKIEEYRGITINLDHYREDDFGYFVSGEFWVDEAETTRDGAAAIVAESTRRGAVVRDDSEHSCFFLDAATAYDARILVDVLHDQGRVKA
jgi:hypothetical protein